MVKGFTVVAVAFAAAAIAAPASAAPSPEVVALRGQVNALKKELRDIKKDIKTLGKNADNAADKAEVARTLAAQANQGAIGAKSQADLAFAKTNCLINVVPATIWGNYVFMDPGNSSLFKGSGIDVADGDTVPRFWLAGVNPSCVPSVLPSYLSSIASTNAFARP